MKKHLIYLLLLPTLIAGCAGTRPAPPREIDHADSLLYAKQYQEAIAAYRIILKDHPESSQAAEAKYNIAAAHVAHDNAKRDYTQALREFEEFLKQYPDHPWAHDAKNWRMAIKSLLEARKENEQLKKNIEQLKKLDIRQEEKRSKRRQGQ